MRRGNLIAFTRSVAILGYLGDSNSLSRKQDLFDCGPWGYPPSRSECGWRGKKPTLTQLRCLGQFGLAPNKRTLAPVTSTRQAVV